MAIEFDRVLEVAGSRTKSIPELIKNNHVYWQSRWDKTLLTQVLCAAFTSDMKVKGVPNLKEAEELAAITALSVASNHVSDGDHATRRKVIQRLGFRDFAEKCVYIGGLRMMERFHIRMLVPAESMLLIPTPFDFDNLKGALKDIRELKDGGQLTKDEYDEYHKFLKGYGEKCMDLNQRAEEEREKYTKKG